MSLMSRGTNIFNIFTHHYKAMINMTPNVNIHLLGVNLRVSQAIIIMVLVIVVAQNQLTTHPNPSHSIVL